MRHSIMSAGLSLCLIFSLSVGCSASAFFDIGALKKIDSNGTEPYKSASSIIHFIDTPFELSAEDIVEYMRQAYGIELVSTLTGEDRRAMADDPSLEMHGKITAPFDAATFLDYPVSMRFRLSQNKVSGVYLDFMDEDVDQYEETSEARRAKRQDAADIYFSLASHLQEVAGSPQDAIMIVFTPPTETEKGYSTYYNYPMEDGQPDVIALRKIINKEGNIVLIAAYENVQITYDVSFFEWETMYSSYRSCYYIVNMLIDADEITNVVNHFERKDYY